MKSSEPLFTSENPFKPASRRRTAHYYPSRLHSLSKEEKQTCLSPERLKKKTAAQNQQQDEKHAFPPSARDKEDVFTEIWPSSEWHLSSPGTTVSERLSPELGQDHEPVLAKYIERFRHGAPQSREKRQHLDDAFEEKQHPFWWMADSNLPHSSTPSKERNTAEDTRPLKDDLEPCRSNAEGLCHRYSSSLSNSWESNTMLSEAELYDTEISNLQERADRLLLQDECTLSDRSIHVSSEGVGCSDYSSPVSVDEPLTRPLTFAAVQSTSAKGTSGEAQPFKKSVVTRPLMTSSRPEEDILFQWRLRRKLEQARECPQPLQRLSLHGPTLNWQTPNNCSPSDTREAYKERAPHSESFPKAKQPQSLLLPQSVATESKPSCPQVSAAAPYPVVSGSSIPEQQAVARFPALMHLHCDVLPCLGHSFYVGQEQNISKKKDNDVSHKATQVAGNIMKAFSKEAVCENRPSSPHTGSDTRPKTPPLQRRVEQPSLAETRSTNSEKLTTAPKKKLKKSRRNLEREHADASGATPTSSSHENVPRAEAAQVEQRSQEEGQEKEDAPPPSSIQHALEQVVSDVLFPTRDSSPKQRTPVLSNCLPHPASAHQQSDVSSDVLKSVDVISQLLQETEDSDEKEFEDDPLLQVLRKQRSWVKEQISEVDSLLTELHDEQAT